LSGQEDVVVGATFAGRENLEYYPLIGYFVNILPLRSDLSGNPSFGQLLSQVRTTLMEALEHQDLPFQLLVQALAPPRIPGRSPIFQVAMRFLHENNADLELPGLVQEFSELPTGYGAYELSLIVLVGENNLTGRLEFMRMLFSQSSAERMVRKFLCILNSVVAIPDVNLRELIKIAENEI
jgi:non-ribosomal peptide synthetase component F